MILRFFEWSDDIDVCCRRRGCRRWPFFVCIVIILNTFPLKSERSGQKLVWSLGVSRKGYLNKVDILSAWLQDRDSERPTKCAGTMYRTSCANQQREQKHIEVRHHSHLERITQNHSQ
jgi:hypothetical protein